jgi:hypothetical protein
MALIRIEHNDFVLQVSCGAYDALYAEAKRNIAEDALWASYACSDQVEPQFFSADDAEGVPLDKRAFFFDNADYGVFVQTRNGATAPSSAFTSVAMNGRMQRFGNDILTGTLNFGNDIGKFDLAFSYRKGAIERRFCFTLEILSLKLDYHRDWMALIREIEAEHQTLALDFLKETYHSFDTVAKDVPKDQTADMIWWCLFKSFQDQFVKGCRLILNRPRNKWRQQSEYLRADQLRIMAPDQENEYAEHRWDATHLYYSERTVDDKDTPENRFLKMAVGHVTDKYATLSEYLLRQTSVSDAAKAGIREMKTELSSIRHNAFFRGIGRFSGLRQESLILQRASGYSTVYRIWAILKMMYSLGGDKMRLESKDIATLYEMWCFIRVKNAVAMLTGVDEKAKTALKDYVYRLFTGEKSQVVFRDGCGIELAEVSYNSSSKATSADGIEGTVAPTTKIAPGSASAERPDIVLRLIKTFGGDDHYKVTYLFDAKYRIQGRYANGAAAGVDYPPQDAIDQMHRYRDAIYYQNRGAGASAVNDPLKKEIIGGYVLFPGNGDKGAIEVAPFMQARNEVNIGAFPLRPGNDANNEILRDFLDGLLNKSEWVKHLEEVIAQKGMVQVVEAEAELGADNILAGTAQLTDEEARWVYNNKAIAISQKMMGGRNPKSVRVITLGWRPPVSLVIDKGGYVGTMTTADITARYGSCPFSQKDDAWHVWTGKLVNQQPWEKRFGNES